MNSEALKSVIKEAKRLDGSSVQYPIVGSLNLSDNKNQNNLPLKSKKSIKK